MSAPRESQPRLRLVKGQGTDARYRTLAEARGGSARIAFGALPGSVGPVPVALPGRAAKSGSVRPRFGELRSALKDGWEIVQPIFARPLWSSTDDSATAFNFVLRRDAATRLVTVPEGRTVQRFIRDKHLLVDYRR